MSDALVTTAWLAEHLHHPGLRVIDASYVVPGGTAPARRQFLAARIPGAQFFDINEIADRDDPKEHAFPNARIFAARVGAIGIGNGHWVVAYDHMGGTMAAARAWFMFRAFGHTRVAVLSGGFSAWLAEGWPIESGEPAAPTRVPYSAAEPDARLRRRVDMQANVTAPAFQVLDARAEARFTGAQPEPRPGLRQGHIPGSKNLPYLELLDPETMTFKPPEDIRKAFMKAGIDLTAPLTTTCGSGVTACVVALAADLIGKTDIQLYDGSWLEWGADPSLPVAVGSA